MDIKLPVSEICGLLLWLIVIPCIAFNYNKKLAVPIGITIAALGYVNKRHEAKPEAKPVVAISPVSKAMPVAGRAEEAQEIPIFDMLEALSNPTMPHYKLYAPSGSGKTTTIGWMAKLCKEAGSEITVISPHLEGDEVYLNYADTVVIGSEKAYAKVSSLFDELQKRKNAMPWCDNKANFKHLTYIIDEAVSLFSDFKEKDAENKRNKAHDYIVPKWVKLLVEARKYKIRIILATQSNRVSAIGLEGRGDVTECLTTVYLGVKAKSMLKRSPAFTEAQKAKILAEHKYFALVEYAEEHFLTPLPTL